MRKIDVRGFSCPAPQVVVMQALEQLDEFEVIVDDGVARENIERMLVEKYQLKPMVEHRDEGSVIHVKK